MCEGSSVSSNTIFFQIQFSYYKLLFKNSANGCLKKFDIRTTDNLRKI